MSQHTTVLLNEAVSQLVTNPQGRYVDGTFGRGGHSEKILQSLNEHAQLLAIDKDHEAIQVAHDKFAQDARFAIEQCSFAELSQLLDQRGWQGSLDGLLLDLGVSSPQLDQSQRGFSFNQSGPLDMRMDHRQKQTAATWINSIDEASMICAFKTFGEERYSKRIAGAIIKRRTDQPFTTTDDLARVVSEAHPAWERGRHPATKVFQAIRIVINNELDDLSVILGQCIDALKVGGRLVVISFHSLEDRQVKRFIRAQEKGDALPADLPVKDVNLNRRLRSVTKAIKPSQTEIDDNPRARSAIMRVAEKVA